MLEQAAAHITVDDNDILVVCSEPRVEAATEVYQPLKVGGTLGRPLKVSNLQQ